MSIHAHLKPEDGQSVQLSPDAVLTTDASNCIVLVTPERRITVTNVDAWIDALRGTQFRQQVRDGEGLS